LNVEDAGPQVFEIELGAPPDDISRHTLAQIAVGPSTVLREDPTLCRGVAFGVANHLFRNPETSRDLEHRASEPTVGFAEQESGGNHVFGDDAAERDHAPMLRAVIDPDRSR
jgi:hypothetical protein